MTDTATHPTTLAVGDAGPALELRPTPLSLFRYSAVTWNMHRIHYDAAWAAHERHPGVLVHSHFHAAHSLRAVTAWLGGAWTVTGWDYRILRPAFAGSTLTAQATVAAMDGDTATLGVVERDGDGNICLEGKATVVRA